MSLEFSLMEKCHARFIKKKISQLKSDIRSYRCKNFSLKVLSVRSDEGGGGFGSDPRTLPLDPPLLINAKEGKVSCLLINSSARQKEEGNFSSQVPFLLNCHLLLYRWLYDRVIAWWFPIPSGNEDLLVKIAEKEMKLEQQAKRYCL